MKIHSIILISTIAAASLFAVDSVNLDKVTVQSTAITTEVTDVAGEDLKSADLAEALTKASPSITLQRRSGIANDIILRGQRKDNINILVDGGKIYGACPNRMDPPTSHIITNNIKDVEIIEGPYDVEDFGTLSGAVKITTTKPAKKLSGNVNLNFGSWHYRKASAYISGGNDTIRALLDASTEQSGQYKDGNGDKFQDQLVRVKAPKGNLYQDKYKNMDAYKKKSVMGKVYVNIMENQELQLSYTANRSDNVLYPSTPMDAISDDSDLFNAKYIITNLGKYSDRLAFEYYYSQVDHPMTNQYRNIAVMKNSVIANVMSSQIYGGRIKNDLTYNGAKISLGLDASKRNWDGTYYKKYLTNPTVMCPSIPDVDTKNFGVFAKAKKTFGKFETTGGLRYDHTKIEAGNDDPSKTYNDVSGYVFTYLQATDSLKYFVGLGKSIRVPDGKESHYRDKKNNLVGNPNLNETKNYEADMGAEGTFENATFRAKVFYSKLKDFIIYNAKQVQYQNVDAKIYGTEVSGTYFVTDDFYLDGGIAYQRGKKDEPLPEESDMDLPSIPPVKANFSLNYDNGGDLKLQAEVVASGKWGRYDKDNGEQKIPGWGVLNLKANKKIYKGFNVTVGVDNVFDKAYAVSNTYKDLMLVDGTVNQKRMLLNEPGRYMYVNLSYKF